MLLVHQIPTVQKKISAKCESFIWFTAAVEFFYIHNHYVHTRCLIYALMNNFVYFIFTSNLMYATTVLHWALLHLRIGSSPPLPAPQLCPISGGDSSVVTVPQSQHQLCNCEWTSASLPSRSYLTSAEWLSCTNDPEVITHKSHYSTTLLASANKNLHMFNAVIQPNKFSHIWCVHIIFFLQM